MLVPGSTTLSAVHMEYESPTWNLRGSANCCQIATSYLDNKLMTMVTSLLDNFISCGLSSQNMPWTVIVRGKLEIVRVKRSPPMTVYRL